MKNSDIISILKSLPINFMTQTAEELHTDYKAKKLGAIRLFALLLIGFLRDSAMSQRFACEQSSCLVLDGILGMPLPVTPLAHSSLSERLNAINPNYFARVYDKLFDMAEKEVGTDTLLASNIIRLDTTLVAETCNKLMEGINTGMNKRLGAIKRHVKYGMGYNGLGVVFEKIFTQQKESSEEVALAQTVKEAIRKEDAPGKIFTFDRGTTGYDTLCEVRELCEEKGCHFVSRLKLSRSYIPIEDLLLDGEPRSDKTVEVIEDCAAMINKKAKSKYENKPFRILRVRFIKKRPKTPAGAKRRRYEPEMLLITDNMEAPSLEIVHQYRHRWSIEVFFKFLKQNLKFSHLLSISQNGIKVMLYMTLITALLVRMFALRNGIGNTLAMARMTVQIENWMYTHSLKASNTTDYQPVDSC